MTPERVEAWVFETCMIFGSRRSTAHLVTGEFLKGLGW